MAEEGQAFGSFFLFFFKNLELWGECAKCVSIKQLP